MDISIVCGRRPDLLARTLASFQERIFGNFPVGTVYANIDPFCGTDADGDACEAILREIFRNVEVRRPEVASFGRAVKHLWQQPKSRYFLHMEDDWEVLHTVTPAQIEPRLQGSVVQVQLSSRDRLFLPEKYHYRTTWRSFFGLKIGKRVHLDRPLHATSPSFIVSDFAATCAQMMDPEKDPEKQLYTGETPLTRFTRAYLNHPLQSEAKTAILRDLGRQWLETRGIKKSIEDGVSVWHGINRSNAPPE